MKRSTTRARNLLTPDRSDNGIDFAAAFSFGRLVSRQSSSARPHAVPAADDRPHDEQVREFVESHVCRGELRLWAAVIVAAIADARMGRTDAVNFLFHPSNESGVRQVACLLGADPATVQRNAIRAAGEQWKHTGRGRMRA